MEAQGRTCEKIKLLPLHILVLPWRSVNRALLVSTKPLLIGSIPIAASKTLSTNHHDVSSGIFPSLI
jgi:hypothetical protein